MTIFDLYLPMILRLLGFMLIVISFVVFVIRVKRKKIPQHKKPIILPVVMAFVGLLILVTSSINSFQPEIPFGLKTYGPGSAPTIPITNALKFLFTSNQIEKVQDIAIDPNKVPQPTKRTSPQKIKVELEAKEVIGALADDVYYNFWTFNNTVPGPFLRARVGDTIEISLKNNLQSINMHNIDFHAANGPGGGATVSNVKPGETRTFSFKALNPGIYVYHCAHGNAAAHMAHGMYGLMLIEPEEGLTPVDKEFYIMQGEYYSSEKIGSKGLQVFDAQKMLDGHPEYIVFNGRVDGAVGNMKVKKGERVRLYVGNGGVNLVSSFHVIGEVFDIVHPEGSIGAGSSVFKNVQSTVVPAGGATIVEFTADVPGKYMLVDHALARVDRGAWGTIEVSGDAEPAIFNGQADPNSSHSGH